MVDPLSCSVSSCLVSSGGKALYIDCACDVFYGDGSGGGGGGGAAAAAAAAEVLAVGCSLATPWARPLPVRGRNKSDFTARQ